MVSEAQMRMLRAIAAVSIDDEGADGWAEVEMEFFSNASGKLPVRLEASVCDRVRGALERKGLIDVGEYGGPRLTAKGREALGMDHG